MSLALRRLAPALGARSARLLSAKASAVQALAAEQKALSDAIDALGDISPAKVKAFIAADPALQATMDKVKEADLSWTWSMLASAPSKPPVTVAVAGAGSAVGQAALYRIAAGEMLGLDQPVTLQLLGADAEATKDLEACGFPLLAGVTAATSAGAAMKGAKYALCLEGDAKAIGAAADAACLVGVVGCTNALAAASAGKAKVTGITGAAAVAASKALADAAGASLGDVTNVIAWGNGVADVSHALVGGKWALKATGSTEVPAVEPTAEMAADAAVSHMKAWALGSDGKWVSMGVPAVNDYGMGEGFFYSVPVVCEPGDYKRVGGVSLSPAVATAMEAERQALLSEKSAAGL